MRFYHVDDLPGQIRECVEFHEWAAQVTDDSLQMAVKKYFWTRSLGISEISIDFLYWKGPRMVQTLVFKERDLNRQ